MAEEGGRGRVREGERKEDFSSALGEGKREGENDERDDAT